MIRKSATHSFSPSGCWNTMPSTIYLQHVSVKPKLYSQQRQCGELIMPDTSQQRHNDLMPGANQSSDCHDTMPSISPTGHECSTNKWIGLTYRVVQDNATCYGKKPILRSPEYNAGHQQGSHSTVLSIRSTECQSCTNEWIFGTPFGPEQAGRCQRQS